MKVYLRLNLGSVCPLHSFLCRLILSKRNIIITWEFFFMYCRPILLLSGIISTSITRKGHHHQKSLSKKINNNSHCHPHIFYLEALLRCNACGTWRALFASLSKRKHNNTQSHTYQHKYTYKHVKYKNTLW